MTKTDQSTTPTPQSSSQQWLWPALASGAALTVAGNYLLYSRGPGAGWSVFFLLLAAAIFVNRRSDGQPHRIELALAAVLAVSAAQMIIRPSFSNAVVLFTLTLLASAHFLQDRDDSDLSPGRKFIEALRNLFISPIRWFEATGIAARCGLASTPVLIGRMPTTHNLGRACQILIPTALVTIPFFILLGKGNSIFGQFISNTITRFIDMFYTVQPPSPGRVFFIAFIATLILGILWRSQPSRAFDKLFTKLGRTIPAPSDHFVARWRTILILVGVNVLFFAANSIDLTYLAVKNLQLPEHLTYSQFVHQGTNTLIASAIIAAIVLGLLFQQDTSVTNSRAVRALAITWIAQNILLIINVARRVGIYIGDYHLTALRLHLLVFLALVCFGFILLAIRVHHDKSFGWLMSANLTAVFVLFATIQFWDTRKLVAEYNLERSIEDQGKTLDTYYLKNLGPSAWPSLRAALTADLSADERNSAARMLSMVADEEAEHLENADWRDFTLARHQLRAGLVTR